MNALRANWWLVPLFALFIAIQADLLLDAPITAVIAALLHIPVAVMLGWWSRLNLQRAGAQPLLVSLISIVVIALVGSSLLRAFWAIAPPGPMPDLLLWLRWLAEAALWVAVTFGWMVSNSIVRFLGGPRSEWSALRERATIWIDIEEMGEEEVTRRDAEIAARIRAMDRFRSPATAEYIDTYQMLMLGDESEDVKEVARARFRDLETSLRRSLGTRPTWVDEIERRAIAIGLPNYDRSAHGVTGTNQS